MSEANGVFSLRIVIADYYMEKPIYGLDPCYSEFRGKEIKKVPIIRVFGPNANGQKCSMHVHGVFPYFYIPYEKKDFESVNRALYQIASNVDRAINISLGQSNSSAQHVFKVQLVKGIPFYGYHRTEHQFFKIYMFNPRFVKRAANLLQNGAIMGKIFHPHESHVPYILQFMIDYNLYGMSFLHVPADVVKYRRNDETDEIPCTNIQLPQILDCSLVKKQTISALEIDIASNFILNRFQLVTKNSSQHTNPGIEAIWHDEQIRRKNLLNSMSDGAANFNTIPPLEVPVTQPRPDVQVAESEIFYRTGLLTKLATLESSVSGSGSMLEQTIGGTQQTVINSTMSKATPSDIKKKRTFNINKLMVNAVYPEECTQDQQQLTNASFIDNHLAINNIFQKSLSLSNESEVAPKIAEDESVFMDDTILDEDLVFSLTQQHLPMDATLRKEDMQLLDVLQQLEEQAEEENKVDLDSTLAPLSQAYQNYELSPKLLEKETVASAANQPLSSDEDSDAENDESKQNVLDFSVALDTIEDFILKFSQNEKTPTASPNKEEKVPQIDGSDDLLPRTPTKKRVNLQSAELTSPRTPKHRTSVHAQSPQRSPRTPKSIVATKYAPLPLIISNKSDKKTSSQSSNTLTPCKADIERKPITRSSIGSLRKELALTEMHRKSISASNVNQDVPKTSVATNTRRSRRLMNLDKTHITCSLTPRKKNERLLKVYSTKDENLKAQSKGNEQPEPHISSEQINEEQEAIATTPIEENVQEVIRENVCRCSKSPAENVEANSIAENKRIAVTETNSLTPTTSNTVVAIKALNAALQKFNKSHTTLPTENSLDTEDDADEVIASDEEGALSGRAPIKLRKTPNLKRLRRSFIAAQRVKLQKQSINYIIESNLEANEMKTDEGCRPTSSPAQESDGNEELELITSFNERSFCIQSPTIFSNDSSPALSGNIASANTPKTSKSERRMRVLNNCEVTPTTSKTQIPGTPADEYIAITPMELPPTRADVLAGCQIYGIQEFEFQRPYYSNPSDITKPKEIGFTVLNISGNKLNDCEPFESVLGDRLHGLNSWRRQKLVDMGGPIMLNRFRTSERVREYYATNKTMVIQPAQEAPSRQDAKLWVKAREVMQNKNLKKEAISDAKSYIEEDSPIKIKRQKITMMMNDEDLAANSSDEGDVNISTCSLSLTPTTPGTPLRQRTQYTDITPLSTLTSDKTIRNTPCKSLRSRAKLSLNGQLNEVALVNSNKEHPNEPLAAEDNIATNSQKSESSISSQVALAALERSSFLHNVQIDSLATPGRSDISFGLTNATLDNTYGFKVKLENLHDAKADIEYNFLTIITLEVFANTRMDLNPDPQYDEIRCIFYAIENSIPSDTLQPLPRHACGYIIVNDTKSFLFNEGKCYGLDKDIEVLVVATEIEAIQALIELCGKWDADIYAGYEIEMSSWGYVIDRAKSLCFNIAPLLSRVPTQKPHDLKDDDDREQYTDLDFEMKLCGRILLDVWRLMRSEIALTSYTFENVMYHIMHKRCPWHSYRKLTEWFASPCSRWIVLEYYLERVRGTLKLLDQLDLIGRTSEMAKLIGIQFYEILSRGSQFRVESMMLRIAKPKNLVPLSPSVQQRVHMRAPEYIALIMEPQSRFYADPVIVLDFQSLYPSMIIAYNYCFSTCLGRVEHLGSSSPFEFGASQLRVSPTLLRKLLDEDLVTISPCGVVFVKSSVREGILPRMLKEILDTRQMVKQSMKIHKSNSALQRILHSRQLGLKLMANVTYGYTAANFSGRMPSVEVGDSVVSKGRETLQEAIKYVEANDRWNVRVVYGDTDSLFVLVPGRNRAQAFKIGEEIAAEITKANPHPVKLKLEKVYQPCILQTKKRYVGYMYESSDQEQPIYEAKGIETVRRDGCPAVAKMLEKVLRILFETTDVSLVKQYVCRQFTKLLLGRANLQDLIFAKEFRGLNGYKPTACVPALELTRKWIKHDPRRIPRRGERVPFIVTNGPPGVPLIRLVRHPHDVLHDEGLKINAIYYITKAIIPPLNRCLLLIGADVNEWFANLPRKLLITPALSTAKELISTNKQQLQHQFKKSTISQYFSSSNCIIDCGRHTMQGICAKCALDSMKVVVTLHAKIGKLERGYYLTQQMCQTCCGRIGDLECGSLDCPVLYVLEVKRRGLQQIQHIRSLLDTQF